MSARSIKPAVDAAAAQLRNLALTREAGAFLGSEDVLLQQLGFSRSTVRQVARLLEQEGLIRVKRGIGGGYYAARPDAGVIEQTVSNYLETIDMDAEDVTVIASALWVEVIRKATRLHSEAARTIAGEFRARILALKPNATFQQVRTIEVESRKAIFALVRSRYIEMIFDINSAFASRHFPPHDLPPDSDEHLIFVKRWREAKLLELSAIADGDEDLGPMAARHVRTIWHGRIWPSRPA